MSDFSGTASILIDHPEILEIYVKGKGKPKKWDKYSEAEKKTFSFFSSLLALLERVWFGVATILPMGVIIQPNQEAAAALIGRIVARELRAKNHMKIISLASEVV